MQYAHAIFVWSFFIFSRSISCSMFYFHVLTLLNFEFWISDRSKPHLESALYYRGNSNHSCSLSFSLVSRISPPEKNSRLEFWIFWIFWEFFLFFTQIFLRSNSGCHDGGVRAGYALHIMENWGFGTAPGTIQTQIMLSSCYDFGFSRRRTA